MLKRIKSGVFMGLIITLFYNMLLVFNKLEGQQYPYQNRLDEIYPQTHAANLVTGIYLDYRLYDTIFEATILFVVATGIIFMVKKDVEMIDQLQIGAVKLFSREKKR